MNRPVTRWLPLVALATIAGYVVATAQPPPPTPAATPAPARLDETFHKSVRPFVQSYCLPCHGADRPKGDLDLSPFTTLESVAKDHRRWALVLDRLRAGDMPPADAKRQPTKELRREVIDWAEAVRRFEGDRTAGDPGPVPARRLSNAEYDHTVRDLTGVDVRPTRDFPVDPANEAGFDNSAESLTTSPALVRKYLEAARRVADHLVLTPNGFAFAPYPAVADTDRDKYAVNRVVAFYKAQRTDPADYFHAAWRYRNRAALGKPAAALADFADGGLSAKYLATVWALLSGPVEDVGPVAALRALWRELPDGAENAAAASLGCDRMRDFAADLRAQLVPVVPNLTSPGVHDGSQPLVLWKNRQTAATRTKYVDGALKARPRRLFDGSAAAKAMTVPTDAAAAKAFEATFGPFCATFPDAFVVTERARVYLDPEKEKKLAGRLLSAGFHSQMGYFRDDAPLCDLVLDAAQKAELDRLWVELDFVTNAPVRQYTGFLWFERADSSFLRDPEFFPFRAEDRDCTSDAKVGRLAELYLAKAVRHDASETARGAIRDYFSSMRATFRRLEKERADAEPRHVAALHKFAERAYRRPLTPAERDDLTGFYRALREKDGLGHEDAVRDAVVGVLMSPHFCFRVDLPGPGVGAGATRPLSDHAVASRLSYFLWASMPDESLLERAAAGELRRPDVLAAEAKRMLRDGRARGLATEFAGNWLDFRRFGEHNAVDRGRFPQFDNDLRAAMFEEPVRFFADLAARDGSVLDFLYADHTFVNPPLARHYGLPAPIGGADTWARADGARAVGRGGVLPMAVFLTKNAPGLRTSPVKRGYWVARRVLGEAIPAPPPNVPELPADEAKLGELSLRDALARHRADKACAGCHERFDSLGLVFEGYGPVGERRAKDLGGRPVETAATFPGGSTGDGLVGLTAYVRARREPDFVDNLCRKLLAYALNRTLLPSDEQLLRETRGKLDASGHRFSVLVEAIVTSPQFLNQRANRPTEPAP